MTKLFKAPLFHYKTLLIHDSYWLFRFSHFRTERLHLKSSSKCLLIDLDTPVSLQHLWKVILTEAKTQLQNY